MLLQRDGFGGKLLEAGDERAAEALHAVPMLLDGVALDRIKVPANLFPRVDTVVEIGDEGGDSALEVDVVLPQGVVGVEKQGVPGGGGKLRV